MTFFLLLLTFVAIVVVDSTIPHGIIKSKISIQSAGLRRDSFFDDNNLLYNDEDLLADEASEDGNYSIAGDTNNRRGEDDGPVVVKEIYPCVSFESVHDKAENELTDEQCRYNTCNNGCCRNYNFLVCDENDGMSFIPCVCNENTAINPIEEEIQVGDSGLIDMYMGSNDMTSKRQEAGGYLDRKTAARYLSRGINFPKGKSPAALNTGKMASFSLRSL